MNPHVNAPIPADFDPVDFIMRLEGAGMSQKELVRGFQRLLDSGLILSLQEAYHRMADQLLQRGLISPPGRVLH